VTVLVGSFITTVRFYLSNFLLYILTTLWTLWFGNSMMTIITTCDWGTLYGLLACMTWYQNSRIALQYYAGVVGSQVVSGHWGIKSGISEYQNWSYAVARISSRWGWVLHYTCSWRNGEEGSGNPCARLKESSTIDHRTRKYSVPEWTLLPMWLYRGATTNIEFHRKR
jgi:hypothetical protein